MIDAGKCFAEVKSCDRYQATRIDVFLHPFDSIDQGVLHATALAPNGKSS